MAHTENGTKKMIVYGLNEDFEEVRETIDVKTKQFDGQSCPHCSSEDLEPQIITIIGGKATEINYWCNYCGEMAGSYVEGEYV